MPMREFGCSACGHTTELYHPAVDPEAVPTPSHCQGPMSMLWSIPKVDTSSTFQPFTYRGPTGLYHEINNLHDLRRVEHTYQATGHDIRFDAWSADPSNPDTVDGFGPEYWDGTPNYSTGKAHLLPTM